MNKPKQGKIRRCRITCSIKMNTEITNELHYGSLLVDRNDFWSRKAGMVRVNKPKFGLHGGTLCLCKVECCVLSENIGLIT